MAKVVKIGKPHGSRSVDPDQVSPIVNDVAMPTDYMRGQRRYPLPDMHVGDSFTCPLRSRPSMSQSVTKFRKTFPDRAFTWRVQDGRVRVWRIK